MSPWVATQPRVTAREGEGGARLQVFHLRAAVTSSREGRRKGGSEEERPGLPPTEIHEAFVRAERPPSLSGSPRRDVTLTFVRTFFGAKLRTLSPQTGHCVPSLGSFKGIPGILKCRTRL